MQEKQKHSVFPSTSCSCQYSSLVDDHEGDNEFTICRVIRLLVCGVCVHELALLLCLRINPGAHLCLCVPFHACDFVFMYQSEPICIQALLPFKSYYSPLGLQDGFWPAALSRQLGNAAFLRLSPRNLLLFIMHGTPLDYCRRATLHRCSLQREAETGWRMGSGVQEDPC